MNPFTDKMPTNDTTAIPKILGFDGSSDLSKFAAENFEKIDSKTADREGLKIIYQQKMRSKTGIRKIVETVIESNNGKVITMMNHLNENETPAEANKLNQKTIAAVEAGSGEGSVHFQDVEDVEIPEDEVDEIIVPDEADEAEDLTDEKDNEDVIVKSPPDEEDSVTYDNEIESKSSDSEKKSSSHEVAQEENSIKDYDDEPELIAIGEDIREADNPLLEMTSNKLHLDEDTTSETTMTHDPLNCNYNKEQPPEVASTASENVDESQLLERDGNEIECDEDDDDVQFVETRNSPICIESDDEEINSKESSCAVESKGPVNNALTVPQNIIVTRTSARKSTAKPQQNQPSGRKSSTLVTLTQIQNTSKNNNNNNINTEHYNKQISFDRSSQQIVDCIELLDSSDEESPYPRNGRPKPVPKTPQKRTLLAAKGNYYKTNNNNNKVTNATDNSSRLPTNFPPNVRQQPKKPAPPPLPPPTPQSHFLNAVQLQPAVVAGANPPAFSALLHNKNVIIPNAFYGNPPSITITPDIELERRCARWLENFINQFCKPQFIATHSCLVFLQRALKYKDFVRIKALRANVNSYAHNQSASNELNCQLLMKELRTILLKNTKKATYFGQRFCELTCSAIPGKSVALMAHGISGKVTLKTCNMDIPKTTIASSVAGTSSSSYTSTNSLTRKRQLEEDEDDEYTPDKSKLKKTKPPSENGEEETGEMGDGRKRSLRTKRTRRLDNSFSYNEDDLLAEYEIDDEEDQKLAQVEIQRKIEQKRLEAQKQRQQQVKSFESAFIQAFAKSIEGPTTSAKPARNVSAQRIRLNSSTRATVTNIRQYTAHNDAEDLLQATWIENIENDENHVVISDDDDNRDDDGDRNEEPKEHRIYKQQQQQQQQQQTQTNNSSLKTTLRPNRINQEIITGDNYSENKPTNVESLYWPKNVDSQMYVNGKHKDRCVICNLSCQRLVHHYVNEHRGCEVYNSRLSLTQIKHLKQANYSTVAKVSLYKNGQFQYEAFCIFCQKKSRFLLPYWYQHFSMHTGEYAYRCIGCGVRKPTRSLLTQHQAQGCPEKGGGDGCIAQNYTHDSKTMQIEAKICNLCNYVQLHRINIVKHLQTQHFIKQILPKHIQTIVLLKTPANFSISTTTTTATLPYTPTAEQQHKKCLNNENNAADDDDDETYIIGDDEDEEEIIPDQPKQQQQQQQESNSQNNYYNYIPPYMQAAVNAGNFTFDDTDENDDDLSFMICGMLDVQMNTEAN